MIEIRLPRQRERKLPFYLAMEEWVARNLAAGEYFFTWIVKPTVIVGRNQETEKEVDLAYCREAGIEVYRRKSGGGCVYADRNNLMLSYITEATEVEETFRGFTDRVAQMLRGLGIEAEATGRNDVMAGDRKISGNAFYHLPGRSIVHGTLLYDADRETMRRAITPSKAKLESKGVTSVESRIVTAKELVPGLTLDELRETLRKGMADRSVTLSEAQVKEIEEMEQEYYGEERLLGRRRKKAASYEKTRRIDGVGEVTARVSLDGEGLIDSVELTGDYLGVGDEAEKLLKGSLPTREAIEAALEESGAETAATGLTKEALAELAAQEPQTI